MLRLLLALRDFSMSYVRGPKRSRGPRAAPTIVLDPDDTTKCQICDDGSSDVFSSACGHDFCMNCIGQHFRSSASNLQRISCPVDGCGHEASTYELKKVVGEEAAEEYKTKLILALETYYQEAKAKQPQAATPPACKNCLSAMICVEQIPDMAHKDVQAVLKAKGLKKTRSKVHGVNSLVSYLDRLSQRWTCTGCNYEERPEAGAATKDGEGGSMPSWESSDAYQLYAALMNLEESWKQNGSSTTKQNGSSSTSQPLAAPTTVWATGTGFGGNSVDGNFMKAARKTSAETFKTVDNAVASITKSLQGTSSLAVSVAAVLGSGSLEKELDYLLGSSLLDIHMSLRENSFHGVFKLLNIMASFPELRPNEAIVDKLEKLVEQAKISTHVGESSDVAFCQELTSCYDKVASTSGQKKRREADEIMEISAKSMYVDKLKPMQFRLVSGEAPFPHYFRDSDKQAGVGTDHKRMLRIHKEVASLAVSLPLMWESSVHVCINEDNMSFIKALIIGPTDTPYQNGVFLFDIYLPPAYPNSPPKVQFLTTGGGKVRFNPNLYDSGYVCLSLLGTWSQGPSWVAGESTLLQVLVSIQSLIFVKDPFYNEPGHERYGKASAAEAENKRHRAATLSIAILGAMTKPDPLFRDVILEHFRWKKLEIEQQCDEWVKLDPSVAATVQAVKEQLRGLATTSKATPGPTYVLTD